MLQKQEGLSLSSLNKTSQKFLCLRKGSLPYLRNYRCVNRDEIMEQSDQNHLSSALPKISKACFVDINRTGQRRGFRYLQQDQAHTWKAGSWRTIVPLAHGWLLYGDVGTNTQTPEKDGVAIHME